MLKSFLRGATLSIFGVGVALLCSGFMILSSPSTSSTIPQGAKDAGFTSPALNVDFSTVNPSTWISSTIDGCGGPTSGNRFVYRWWGDGGTAPSCNYLDIENDATLNANVLHIHYPAALTAPGTPANRQEPFLAWPEQAQLGTPAYAFPFAFYTETMFRASRTALNTNKNLNDIINYMVVTHNPPFCGIELDFFEVVTNTFGQLGPGWLYADSALGCDTHGIVGNPSDFLDETVYHTIGTLYTSDGATSPFYKCYYIDGAKKGCWQGFPEPPGTGYTFADVYNFHQYLYFFGWGNNVGAGGAGGNNEITSDFDLYVAKTSVWTCPGGFGTPQNCNGTIVK